MPKNSEITQASASILNLNKWKIPHLYLHFIDLMNLRSFESLWSLKRNLDVRISNQCSIQSAPVNSVRKPSQTVMKLSNFLLLSNQIVLNRRIV